MTLTNSWTRVRLTFHTRTPYIECGYHYATFLDIIAHISIYRSWTLNLIAKNLFYFQVINSIIQKRATLATLRNRDFD